MSLFFVRISYIELQLEQLAQLGHGILRIFDCMPYGALVTEDFIVVAALEGMDRQCEGHCPRMYYARQNSPCTSYRQRSESS